LFFTIDILVYNIIILIEYDLYVNPYSII
jgi:hypothetical protein